MDATTIIPGLNPAPRHGFGASERRRDVRRMAAMASLIDALDGVGDRPKVVPLPHRAPARAAVPSGATATILFFTGVRYERH